MAKPDIGASAEYRFASEALKRGMVPLWPSTDSQPYDMVLDTGTKLIRIQVKGTDKKGPVINFQFSMRDGKKTRGYTKKDVDFIVLYVFHLKWWYIIPVAKSRRGITIRRWAGESSPYYEAWNLLTEEQP